MDSVEEQSRALRMAETAIAVEQGHIPITMIPRGLPVAQEPSKEQIALAREAKKVLGYDNLLLYTAGGRLQSTLESLEIEVLDPVHVFKYQSQFGPAVMHPPVEFVLNDPRKSLDDDDDDDEEEEEPVRNRGHRVGRTQWARIPIAEYAKAVPEFVVRKAIQLKRSLREVELFVEELQTDPDPFLVAVFEEDGHREEYYIEVWEEPKFEGRFVSLKK